MSASTMLKNISDAVTAFEQEKTALVAEVGKLEDDLAGLTLATKNANAAYTAAAKELADAKAELYAIRLEHDQTLASIQSLRKLIISASDASVEDAKRIGAGR